jgi:Arc/MetJ family transcription regulator
MSRSLPYRLHGISISSMNRERLGDIDIATARAKDRTGREDASTGAVPLGNLKGDAFANALMKAETKAKRRVTLSIAGLGWLDETELETHPRVTISSSDSDPLPAGEDPSPSSAAPQHPTADDITTLVKTAQAANVSLEAFGQDMRRLMQLPERQKITKKFLRETMTMSQYDTARTHYGEALRRIVEEDVPDHVPAQKEAANGSEPPADQPQPSQAASKAQSAATDDAEPHQRPPDDEAKAKLRAEALSWGV